MIWVLAGGQDGKTVYFTEWSGDIFNVATTIIYMDVASSLLVNNLSNRHVAIVQFYLAPSSSHNTFSSTLLISSRRYGLARAAAKPSCR